MIKTVYNPDLEKYRAAELNYVKEHGGSIVEHHPSNNVLKHYALIQQITGGMDPTLEDMLDKARACEGQDYANFVREHSASIVRKVREQNASEQNKRSDFMKHYKLVKRIGGVELD
jgi:hypothetical protein